MGGPPPPPRSSTAAALQRSRSEPGRVAAQGLRVERVEGISSARDQSAAEWRSGFALPIKVVAEGCGRRKIAGLGRTGWTGARLPELLVESSRPLKILARVALGNRPGDRDQPCSIEQGRAIVGLDRGMALLAGLPIALGGIDPPDDSTATEVAPGHTASLSNTCSPLT